MDTVLVLSVVCVTYCAIMSYAVLFICFTAIFWTAADADQIVDAQTKHFVTQQTSSCPKSAPGGSLPGIGHLGIGYDITDPGKSVSTVVELLSDCSTTYVNGILYDSPANLERFTPNTACSKLFSVQDVSTDSSTAQQVSAKRTDSWSVGLSVPAIATMKFSLTKSSATDWANTESKQSNSNFVSMELKCQLYDARLGMAPTGFSSSFTAYLQSLPNVFSAATKHQFDNFISLFGTHVVQSVSLGGHLRHFVSINGCARTLTGMTASETQNCLKVEASLKYKTDLSASYDRCKTSSGKTSGQDVYKQLYRSEFTEWAGGDANSFATSASTPADFENWSEALKRNPARITETLLSIPALLEHAAILGKVSGFSIFPSKIEAIRQAISAYIITAAAVMEDATSCYCPADFLSANLKGDVSSPCSCTCPVGGGRTLQCCASSLPASSVTLKVTVHNLANSGIREGNPSCKGPEPYVKVIVGANVQQTTARTNVFTWDQTFTFNSINAGDTIIFESWEEDNGGLCGGPDDFWARYLNYPAPKNWPIVAEKTGRITLDQGPGKALLAVTLDLVCPVGFEGNRCENAIKIRDVEVPVTARCSKFKLDIDPTIRYVDATASIFSRMTPGAASIVGVYSGFPAKIAGSTSMYLLHSSGNKGWFLAAASNSTTSVYLSTSNTMDDPTLIPASDWMLYLRNTDNRMEWVIPPAGTVKLSCLVCSAGICPAPKYVPSTPMPLGDCAGGVCSISQCCSSNMNMEDNCQDFCDSNLRAMLTEDNDQQLPELIVFKNECTTQVTTT